MARQQTELIAQQEEDARQAALYEQRQSQRAKQKARELRLQSQASTRQPQMLQAQTVKSRQDALLELAFQDPKNAQQSLLEQAGDTARFLSLIHI